MNFFLQFLQSGHLLLKATTKFIDVTEEPNYNLRSIQGTIMHLPQDFLYPFFASNTCTLIPLTYVIAFLSITFSVIII